MTFKKVRKVVKITWAVASMALTALEIKMILEDKN